MRYSSRRKPDYQFSECLDQQVRHWLLPAWFYKQANPGTADFTVSSSFKNETSRRWTTLRPGRSSRFYHLDQYGVVAFPEGYSLEIWLYDGENLFVPTGYKVIHQAVLPDGNGIQTIFDSGYLSVIFKAIAAAQSAVLQLELEVKGSGDALRPVIVGLVIRPYSQEGLTRINQLEYDRLMIYVNRKPGLILEQAPSHSFFADESSGDVDRFFQEQSGNSGSRSRIGLCTGLIGYAGLPEQLGPIRFQVPERSCNLPELSHHCWRWMAGDFDLKSGSAVGRIRSGTPWDSFYEVGIQHVKTFSPLHNVQSVDVHQVLVLNRLGLTQLSGRYLKQCLMKVQVNGYLPRRWLGTERFLVGLADYYRFSGERHLIDVGWPVLKRIGYRLMQQQQSDDGEDKGNEEDGYWACASLRELAEMARLMSKLDELQLLKEWYLQTLHRQYQNVATRLHDENRERISRLGSRLLHMLDWSFPLHLWDAAELDAENWLGTLKQKFLWKNGFFAPLEFKGIDLALTVRLCQRLVCQGQEYTPMLNFVMSMAGPNWNWPGAVNPITGAGIGELGHDPQVLYQMLLLWRLIFVHEIDEDLYVLPGIFNDSFWRQPQIDIEGIMTSFGKLSLACHRIGDIIQIAVDSQFVQRPKMIKLKLNSGYQLISADVPVRYADGLIEADPALRRIRLQKTSI